MNMTDSDNDIEKLIERFEHYVLKSFELSKLKILKVSVILFTNIISYSAVVVILLLFVLFSSIGLSLLLGEFLGKLSYGFFIVSAFYLLVFIITYFFLYQWIRKPLANSIIKKVLNKK